MEAREFKPKRDAERKARQRGARRQRAPDDLTPERIHSDQRGNSMTIGKPFKKGQSGNPGGRPKVVAEIKELARAHTGKAIETLVSIMDNPKAAPAAGVSAANALLDRGYGKPPHHITGEVAASYVARLPMPAPDAKTWLESVTVSTPLAMPHIVEDNQVNNTDGHHRDDKPE
jgi:uncharacterized protein DUF5681